MNRLQKKCCLPLRNALKEYGLTQWQFADLLGVSPDTVTRKLRHELPEDVQEGYITLIKEHVRKQSDKD